MKRKTLFLPMFSLLLVALSVVPAQAQTTVILGLCIDGSSSIYASDFQTMIQGIANAIRNNLPHDGTVELCVIQFSTDPAARIEVPPTVIDSDATANSVATTVEGIVQIDGFTAMADGVWLTWDTMKTASTFGTSDKQIINLATDGEPNVWLSLAPGTTLDYYDDVEMVVGWAVAEGLDELDVEAITTAPDVPWLRDFVVYPGGYEAPPFVGPGWVRRVDTFQEFADTIGEKFEIIVPPEPPTCEDHDVEAVAQAACPTELMPGEIVNIDVTVRNNGDFTETFDVTCYYDSVELGTILVVDLAPGESRVLTFTWDTTGVPMNGYAITAWADSGEVIVEVDEDNNWYTMPTTVFVVPEVPLGTILASLSMFAALIGFVGFKRFRTKQRKQ